MPQNTQPEEPPSIVEDAVQTTEDPDEAVRELIESEPINEVFGREATIKIMTVLIDAMGAPIPVTDIADKAGISRTTVYNNVGLLAVYNLIEVDNSNISAKMKSDTVQGFIHHRDAMIGHAKDT